MVGSRMKSGREFQTVGSFLFSVASCAIRSTEAEVVGVCMCVCVCVCVFVCFLCMIMCLCIYMYGQLLVLDMKPCCSCSFVLCYIMFNCNTGNSERIK